MHTPCGAIQVWFTNGSFCPFYEEKIGKFENIANKFAIDHKPEVYFTS